MNCMWKLEYPQNLMYGKQLMHGKEMFRIKNIRNGQYLTVNEANGSLSMTEYAQDTNQLFELKEI